MKQLLKSILPRPVVVWAQKCLGQKHGSDGFYASVDLTDEQVKQGQYKELLGGGEEQWEERGRFQLHLMQLLGLKPEHKLFDVGCGPGRASVHFIKYLNEGNYLGIDYQPQFIKAAWQAIQDEGLVGRKPSLETIDNFDVSHLPPAFDYALAFSVLNHCNLQQQQAFFRYIPAAIKPGGKMLISHADWFGGSEKKSLSEFGLSYIKSYQSQDIKFDTDQWTPGEGLFPIIELQVV